MIKKTTTFFILCNVLFGVLYAQTTLNDNGNWHTIHYTGNYEDFLMPSSTSYTHIEFILVGGDGGYADKNNNGKCFGNGGQGAEVYADFEIGTNASNTKLPLGRRLRFVVGGKGQNNTNGDNGGGAGGGGGTALLDVTGAVSNYRILAVAGAGGGGESSGSEFFGCHDDAGLDASVTEDGRSDDSGYDFGTDGNAGESDDDAGGGGGGGGAFSDSVAPNGIVYNISGKAGGWTGSSGGDSNDVQGIKAYYGGFGFGSGGGAWDNYSGSNGLYIRPQAGGGGGGGYSGGASGSGGKAGGGGGSYVLPGIYDTHITLPNTDDLANGYVQYRFINRTECAPQIGSVSVIEPTDCSQPSRAIVNVTSNAGCNTNSGAYFFTLLKEGDDGFQILSNTGRFENLAKGNYQVNYNKYTVNLLSWDTLDSKHFTINVVGDNESPVPKLKSINAYLDENGEVIVNASDLDDGSTDNCSIDRFAFAQNLNGELTFASRFRYPCSFIGVQTPGVFIFDTAGNSILASGTINVIDALPPTHDQEAEIEIPESIEFTVEIDQGDSFTITEDYLDILKYFKDNCTDKTDLTVSFSALNRTLTCADVGTTITGAAKAKDASGNKSSGIAITINVVDKSAPTVQTCPSDITVNTQSGKATAIAFYNVPRFRSSCGVVLPGTLVSGPASYDEISMGEHTVVYEATNASGQKATCSFTITVEDNEAPTGDCAEGGVLQTNARYKIENYVTLDDWTDNSDVADDLIITQTAGPANNLRVTDDFTVEYTVEDTHGNKTTCSFDVIVDDLPSVRTKNIFKAIAYDGETVLLAPSDIDDGSSSETSPVELLFQSDRFQVNVTVDSPSDLLSGSNAFLYEPFAFMVPTTDTYTFTTDGNAGSNLVLWSAPIQENSGTFTRRPEYVDAVTFDSRGRIVTGNNTYSLEAGTLYYMSIVGLDPGDTFSGDVLIDKPIRGSLPVYRSLSFNCSSTAIHTEKLYVVDSNGLTSSRSSKIRSIAGATNICDPFTVQFQTSTNNETITIPTTGDGYDYVVDWGDGEANKGYTGNASHSYSTANTYTVKIYGDFPRIYFSGAASASKIVQIDQWGANEWSSMEEAFKGCVNLMLNTSDTPNLVSGTTLKGMFEGCTSLTTVPNISSWNLRNATDMSYFLNGASLFNQDISGLNVSSVSVMDDMLNGTGLSRENYDQLLKGWSQLTLQQNVSFSVGMTNFCVSDVEKDKIELDFNWNITDGGKSCPQVEVPDVKGLTLSEAETTLNNAGFDLGNVTGVYSDIVVEGSVIRQLVNAGSDADLGADINLIQSLGSYPILISGVMSGHITGTVTDAIELYIEKDIPDLSVFSLGVVNTPGASAGAEFTLSGTASAGDFIYITSGSTWFSNFFGFEADFQMGLSRMALRGDDAIELFVQDEFDQPKLIDIYGNVNEDGTGTSWEYNRSWSYRKPDQGPNTTFTESEWRIPGVGVFINQALNTNALNPVSFPIGTYGQAYDSTPPVAICKDISGHITEENSLLSIDAADIDNGSYDSTGVVFRSISDGIFNCREGGTQQVTLTVFDAAGNKSTCTSNITITVDPIEVVCKDYTAFLDINGNTTVNYNDVLERVNGPCFGEGAKWYVTKSRPGGSGSDDFSGIISDSSNTDNFFDDGNIAYYESYAFTVPETKDYALNPSFVSSAGSDDYLIVTIYNSPIVPNNGAFASRPNLVGGYVYENGGEFLGALTGSEPKLSLSTGTTYYAQFLFFNTNDPNTPSTGTFTANFADEFIDPINTGAENVDLPKLVNYTSADSGENTLYVVAINDNGQMDYCEATVTVKEQDPFITTWKTDNMGDSQDNQITIPTHSGSAYNYVVDWGDGNTDTGVTGDITHTYATAGIYTVSIKGDFPRIYFANQGDKNKLLTVEQWGEGFWKSFDSAFFGCENLNIINATIDVPNLSEVTNLSSAFENCVNFNGDITAWDTSTITNMNYMFSNAIKFNQNIGSWKTGNVTTMEQMFYNARIFNQNIDGWNVENVTNMEGLFLSAIKFNQDLNSWNVAKVENMADMFSDASEFNGNISAWKTESLTTTFGMFNYATKFNQDISGWKMGKVTNMESMFSNAIAFDQNIGSWGVGRVEYMSYMFAGATAFNQNIGNWKTGNVKSMYAMFEGATSFDQDLGAWDISDIVDNGSSNSGMRDMFKDTEGLSIDNYDNTIIGWSRDTNSLGVDNDDIPQDVVFHGGNSKFCFSTTAKNVLINDHGWTIIDSGIEDCSAYTPLTMIWKTDNPGVTNDNTIRIPFFSNYNKIDWGDGTIEQPLSNNPQHTYTTPGSYTVKIYGHINRFDFENFGDPTDNQKIVEIQQWGNVTWGDLSSAFIFCSNLQVTATDQPNFTGITDIAAMFMGCSSLGDTNAFSHWDVSGIKRMRYLFLGSNFNGDISNWNVSQVNNMEGMFQNNRAFNQDIGGWDVSSLTSAEDMFINAISFSIDNYDKTLIGWATLEGDETLNANVRLSANSTNYCTSEIERQKLIDDYNWNISDGFLDCPLLEEDAMITVWKTDNPGRTDSKTIKIPALGGTKAIDWGDGTIQKNITSSRPQHTYTTAGTYTIKIYGNIGSLDFENFGDPTDNKKLLEVKQWGNVTWESMHSAFILCSNLQVTATDQPNFDGITDIRAMFFGCSSLGTTDVFDDWDVSNITYMRYLFLGSNFNGDISNWEVNKVINMEGMFQNNKAFNQDLSGWDVSALRSAEDMFLNATAFSVDNYDKLLIGWTTLEGGETLQSNVRFTADKTKYCAGESQRQKLIDNYNWSFRDAGKIENCNQAIWTGDVNTSWSAIGNWLDDTLPLTTNNVVVQDAINQPIINSGVTVEMNDLTIESSALFDISDGGAIIVNGDLNM
ncbi:BspA family leucine-rich repeat surface protein, partial [Tenacibaculum sp. 190524A02b]|uniref:BspA family leucine-rich repeat surface protein n=1 Tax=Tenacibaculum vairaonense TaxID=3137860 RepID=UPI0032B234E8